MKRSKKHDSANIRDLLAQATKNAEEQTRIDLDSKIDTERINDCIIKATENRCYDIKLYFYDIFTHIDRDIDGVLIDFKSNSWYYYGSAEQKDDLTKAAIRYFNSIGLDCKSTSYGAYVKVSWKEKEVHVEDNSKSERFSTVLFTIMLISLIILIIFPIGLIWGWSSGLLTMIISAIIFINNI